MSRAFTWHSRACRDDAARIGQLESELHSNDRREQVQLAAIRKAAALRASIQEKIMREMKALTPKAIAQARAGKPALLRMILRATR